MMKNDKYYILMADIIKSRKSDQGNLAVDFKKLTADVNKKFKKKMISPITVTLGDEFQCLLINIRYAIELIFIIEESIFNLSLDIKLRYVLSKGVISSEINKEIGWGMMGNGLTHAREMLNSNKKSKKRFFIDTSIRKDHILNEAFFIYGSIVDDWNKERDYPIISAYNESVNHDYKEVAKLLNKNPDQIWKKEKNIKIMEYYGMKKIIKFLCEEDNDA